MDKKSLVSILIATVFASSAISGSLVYFGMQLNGGAKSIPLDQLDQEIEQGLDNYIKRINNEASAQAQQQNQDQEQQRKTLAQNVPGIRDGDYLRGSADAQYTIIEYSDFDCPYCKRFHTVAPELLKKYDGKVNWVFRNFPLQDLHPNAPYLALAGECVGKTGGNDAFWKFHDAIFDSDSSMDRTQRIKNAATQAGVSGDDVIACADAATYQADVSSQEQEGARAGVTGTPGVFIYNNATGDVTPGYGGADISVYEQLFASIIK